MSLLFLSLLWLFLSLLILLYLVVVNKCSSGFLNGLSSVSVDDEIVGERGSVKSISVEVELGFGNKLKAPIIR